MIKVRCSIPKVLTPVPNRQYFGRGDNWRIRSKRKENLKGQGSYLLTSEGLILTVKRALEHMASRPAKYSAEDAAAVESLAKMLTKERTEVNTEWVHVDTAPSGWTYRYQFKIDLLSRSGSRMSS